MKRCTICEEDKPLSEFYTRYRGRRPQPYCISCTTLRNSMRTYVNGRQIVPSIPEVRAALRGGAVAATLKLKSAGHSVRRSPYTDPEVQAALGVLRDAKGQRQGKQGYVYLITDSTAYKVGYSTNPQARVAELQTGNPRVLSLLAMKPGTEADERALHAKYAAHNILQEWFMASPDLRKEFPRA